MRIEQLESAGNSDIKKQKGIFQYEKEKDAV